MVQVQRLYTIMKTHRFTVTSFARELKVSQSKMSRVLSGDQTLSAESIGIIINKYNVHPNWIFGYVGEPDNIMYMDNLIPSSELENERNMIRLLEKELGEAYKELAQERKKKQGE